jgi:hypothetical protein
MYYFILVLFVCKVVVIANAFNAQRLYNETGDGYHLWNVTCGVILAFFIEGLTLIAAPALF